jgi:Fe-Mn family superoxide dismutase
MLPRSAAAAEPTRRVAPRANPASSEAGFPALPDLGHGPRHPFVLPALPYAEGALAPAISARTVYFHYRRHHAGYVAALNRLLAARPPGAEPLVTIIRNSAGDPARAGLFNNAAQVWNHSFYWRNLTPGGGGRPGGIIAAAIDRSFGGYPAFRERLIAAAISQFGSGWVWLCAEGDGTGLTIRRTANAETPIQVPGVTPLLTIDVWEHAYYLDTQNRRADHVTQLVDRLLNWSFANRILETLRRPANPTPNPPGTAAAAPPQPERPARQPPATLQRASAPADTRAASLARLARRR